jgi:hypothetical protein
MAFVRQPFTESWPELITPERDTAKPYTIWREAVAAAKTAHREDMERYKTALAAHNAREDEREAAYNAAQVRVLNFSSLAS